MTLFIINPPARVDDFKPRYRLPGSIAVSASQWRCVIRVRPIMSSPR